MTQPRQPKQYPWKRYCARQSATPDDTAWFEPIYERATVGAKPKTLDDYRDVPCLVILGEPGGGKTTELFRLANGRQVIELGGFGDEKRLQDRIHGVLQLAASDRDHAGIFLDALDEAMIPMRTAADVLLDELQQFRSKLTEFRLRLTCRTGAWTTSVERRLCDLFGEQNVAVSALQPLTSANVLEAARVEGDIDGDAFVKEVRELGIVPLASRPNTLRLLFDLYAKAAGPSHSARLPQNRWELYDQGTFWLLTEPPERERRGTAGVLPTEDRREIAAIIATLLHLGQKAELARSFQPSGSAEVLSQAEVLSWITRRNGEPIAITRENLTEVLYGGLFSGDDNAHFSHNTLGEFLVAWRLSGDPLVPFENILALLQAGDSLIRPQLHELAAWIAAGRKDIWDWLVDNEPSVLLLGDVGTADDGTKTRLTDAILARCQERKLSDELGGWSSHLGRLQHVGLPTQLCSWIPPTFNSRPLDIVTRRVAFLIAMECAQWGRAPALNTIDVQTHWRPFVEASLTIALDASDNENVRSYAVHAVDYFGSDEAIRQLRPLLACSVEVDPDLQLRGGALHALWSRRFIPIDTVIEALSVESYSHLIGQFRGFVERDLLEHIHPEEISAVVAWVRTRQSDDRSVPGTLLDRAWTLYDRDDVKKELLGLALARMERFQPIGISEEAFSSNSERRHRMLLDVADVIDVKWFPMDLRRAGLLRSDDIRWLLDLHRAERLTTRGPMLRRLIRGALDNDKYADTELLLQECLDDPLLDGELNIREERLSDQHVGEIRKAHKEQVLRSKKIRSADSVIDDLLNRPEVDAWWNLCYALALEGTTEKQHEPWNRDATTLPGWINDVPRQSKIRMFALRYLRERDPGTDEWIGTSHFSGTVLAGVLAMKLVATDPALLQSLAQGDLRRWTPAIAIHGEVVSSDLLTFITSALPDNLASTFRSLALAKEDQSLNAMNLRRAVDWWCQPVEAVFRALATDNLGPEIDRAVMEVLVERDPATFRRAAWVRLEAVGTPVGSRIQAAAVLFGHLGSEDAERWWATISGDELLSTGAVEVISKDADVRGRKNYPDIPAQILAEMYKWLMSKYPPAEDPGFGRGARFLGARDFITQFRDGIIEVMVARAGPNDVEQLVRLEGIFPNRLRWALQRARTQNRSRGWRGWTTQEILHALTSSRVTTAVEAGALNPPSAVGATGTGAAMRTIDEVFPLSGYPEVNHQPLDQDARIRSVMNGGFTALMLEGPAATGKSTAVEYARRTLSIPIESFQRLQCADPPDRERLRVILNEGLRNQSGYLIVDDVHALQDRGLRRDLIGAIKVAIDERKGPKCILIGTAAGMRTLRDEFTDVSHRAEVVQVQASESVLRKVIESGAQALGVTASKQGVDALLKISTGSTQIAQHACNLWFKDLQSRGSQTESIDVDFEAVREMLLSALEAQRRAIERFVKEAGEGQRLRAIVIALLWEIGRSTDGQVELGTLTGGLWDDEGSNLATIRERPIDPSLPFRFDGATFVVEDLRSLCLLCNWRVNKEWNELRVRVDADIVELSEDAPPRFPFTPMKPLHSMLAPSEGAPADPETEKRIPNAPTIHIEFNPHVEVKPVMDFHPPTETLPTPKKPGMWQRLRNASVDEAWKTPVKIVQGSVITIIVAWAAVCGLSTHPFLPHDHDTSDARPAIQAPPPTVDKASSLLSHQPPVVAGGPGRSAEWSASNLANALGTSDNVKGLIAEVQTDVTARRYNEALAKQPELDAADRDGAAFLAYPDLAFAHERLRQWVKAVALLHRMQTGVTACRARPGCILSSDLAFAHLRSRIALYKGDALEVHVAEAFTNALHWIDTEAATGHGAQ